MLMQVCRSSGNDLYMFNILIGFPGSEEFSDSKDDDDHCDQVQTEAEVEIVPFKEYEGQR